MSQNVQKKDKLSPKDTIALKAQRERDKEKVRGIFRFYEVPGGTLPFSYGPMYKGDETERFDLVDGQVYTVPLGVAKHLNTNGWYPEYAFVQGETGTQGAYNAMTGTTMRIGTKKRRFGFQSLEFTDIDGLTQNPSEIVTVENVLI